MFDLKKLFEGAHHLSVPVFKERIAAFSPAEQKEYYHKAFGCSLQGFDKHSERYRCFFHHLVQSHRQDFLHFLQEKTILGHLRYHLHDKDLFLKMVYLLERNNSASEASRQALVFALILSFRYDLKISSLNQYMKTNKPDAADIADLLEMIHENS
jgi:hypothetical protein